MLDNIPGLHPKMSSIRLLSLVTALPLLGLLGHAQAAERVGAIKDLRIAVGKKTIAEAWFADPVTRYRHFVLGSSYEPETLVVRLQAGGEVRLTLPEDSVFEDRQPRIAELGEDGREFIVVVRSYLQRGAALAVVGLNAGKLEIIAETPPTGRPNTWLNPAGIADFDGDGLRDIAYVQMPHVLGRLRVVTLKNGKLLEIATTENVSNHRIGSAQLGLSAVADFDGDGVPDLAIPSLGRHVLRILTFRGGLRELGRHVLTSPADGTIAVSRTNANNRPLSIIVHLEGGQQQELALSPPLR